MEASNNFRFLGAMRGITFFCLLFSVFVSSIEAFAQNHQLSGYIRDASSGETLIGATVWSESERIKTASNTYGFYSISLPQGPQRLVVSYIGYAPQKFELTIDEDVKTDFTLAAAMFDASRPDPQKRFT